MINIRHMTKEDDAVVCEISAECHRYAAGQGDFTQEQLAVALREHCSPEHVARFRIEDEAFVAESEGVVGGVIVIKGDTVQALFVSPDMHRKGIGRALFEHAEKVIAEAGLSVLKVKTAQSAMPFYAAMGMKRAGNWSPPGGPFVRMEYIALEKRVKRRWRR